MSRECEHRFAMRLSSSLLLLSALLGCTGFTPVAQAAVAEARARMLVEIDSTIERTQAATGVSELGESVRRALQRVPRHEFVPEPSRPLAYENRPLPIGYGQTISQPYIVALMTELLGIDERSVVLEVGTGSAYQAAVLGEIAAQVYTIEIVEPLGVQARARLERLGYDNVTVRVGDGYFGWRDHAPYDAIIVTAAGEHVPPPLVEQLKPGGRLVIPVGPPFSVQQLLLVEKSKEGSLEISQILPVRFVPLTGGQ